MSQILVDQVGPTSPSGTLNFTGANPPTYNGLPFAGGGGSGGSGTGPISGWEDPRPIRPTPPAPVSLVATGAFKSIILSWDLEDYINHAWVEVYRATVNNRVSSVLIGKAFANGFNDPGVVVGTTYFYWIRAISIEGISGPYSSADNAGVTASVLKVANADLGALVVEAANLANNSITASKVLAGAIGNAAIANNVITAGKLFLTGRGAALNDDPACSDVSAWTSANIINVSDGIFGTYAIQSPAAYSLVISKIFPILGNRHYRLQVWARKISGTGNVYFRLHQQTSNATDLGHSTSLENITPLSTWTKYSVDITTHADSAKGYLTIDFNYPAFSAIIQVQGYSVEEMTGPDLIVDGAIQATKLSANCIAVGTAAIEDAAINRAMIALLAVDDARIANATITDAKIATLNASKINAGFLDANRIEAGTITAAKINSTGLTIRNSSGTVILDASGAGVMNWNVLAGQPAGIYNSNVTLSEASGVITLGGAGGGSVTAITTNNPITSGNIGVYMSSAAIGLAYINTASITSLSALSAEMGNVVVSTSGSIRSGQSAFNTGIGWWLGTVAGHPKFSIGNPAGSYLTYDESTGQLTLNGAVTSNPILPAFSVSIPAGDLSTSVSNGNVVAGTRTAAVVGGTAPLIYNWTVSVLDDNTGLPTSAVYISSGGTTDTITIKASGVNSTYAGGAFCTVTDATGRTIQTNVSIYIIQGSGS